MIDPLSATPAVQAVLRTERPWWLRLMLSKFVWMALIFCVLGYVAFVWIKSMGGPTVFRDRYGLVAPLISIPVQAVACVSPFPSDLIAIANGTLYGFWLGSLYSWVAWWSAAQLQYVLGRQMRVDLNLDEQTKRLPAWLQAFPVHHPVFLILSRQIPWAGGHFSTLVPAAAGVDYRRFLWCSAIAVVPGALLYGAMGVGLLKLSGGI